MSAQNDKMMRNANEAQELEIFSQSPLSQMTHKQDLETQIMSQIMNMIQTIDIDLDSGKLSQFEQHYFI